MNDHNNSQCGYACIYLYNPHADHTMHVDGFSTFLMTVLLSMGGSWFLQNNLSNELKGQLMNHITEHSKEITEHAKELFELRTKVNAQAVEINELREKTKEQNKKIIDHNNIIIELKSRINLFEKYFKVSVHDYSFIL